jgi:hypothetical protein
VAGGPGARGFGHDGVADFAGRISPLINPLKSLHLRGSALPLSGCTAFFCPPIQKPAVHQRMNHPNESYQFTHSNISIRSVWNTPCYKLQALGTNAVVFRWWCFSSASIYIIMTTRLATAHLRHAACRKGAFQAPMLEAHNC